MRMLDARKEEVKQSGDLAVLGDDRMQALFEMKEQFLELKNQFDELKPQFEEMKLQFDRALADIWNLKMQIWEVNQQLSEGKKTWYMRVSALLVACVGVVIGLLLTMLWK